MIQNVGWFALLEPGIGKIASALHSASCTNPGVCMGCGYTGEMDISHIGDLNWERTETEHWQVCTACGQTVWGPYEHYAACDNPTVCRDCEYAGPIESIAHIGDYTLSIPIPSIGRLVQTVEPHLSGRRIFIKVIVKRLHNVSIVITKVKYRKYHMSGKQR